MPPGHESFITKYKQSKKFEKMMKLVRRYSKTKTSLFKEKNTKTPEVPIKQSNVAKNTNNNEKKTQLAWIEWEKVQKIIKLIFLNKTLVFISHNKCEFVHSRTILCFCFFNGHAPYKFSSSNKIPQHSFLGALKINHCIKILDDTKNCFKTSRNIHFLKTKNWLITKVSKKASQFIKKKIK